MVYYLLFVRFDRRYHGWYYYLVGRIWLLKGRGGVDGDGMNEALFRLCIEPVTVDGVDTESI